MKIEHLAIWVDDIELLREFYMKYFNLSCGEKYINVNKHFTSYFLSFGQDKTRIELMNSPCLEKHIGGNRMRGLAHFAVSVGSKEKVNALTQRLREDGYSVVSEPRTTGDGYYESAVLDPEGNCIEITE